MEEKSWNTERFKASGKSVAVLFKSYFLNCYFKRAQYANIEVLKNVYKSIYQSIRNVKVKLELGQKLGC